MSHLQKCRKKSEKEQMSHTSVSRKVKEQTVSEQLNDKKVIERSQYGHGHYGRNHV